ncbi:MAG: pyruvate kinase, partial [Proteobacteria bacterium]|nr:pyruvate kinase [Pseudomonadota bacterium]
MRKLIPGNIKKTKIIATISNAKCSPDFLRTLYEAGMDLVRMNTAHQTTQEAIEVISNVRAVSDRIAIMVDTKGPEIRTTPTREDIYVKAGDMINVRGAKDELSSRECVCVNYDGLAGDVKVDDWLLVDDGDVGLKVVHKDADTLTCVVMNDGSIKGRKGVNIPCVQINLPSLSAKDEEFVRFA